MNRKKGQSGLPWIVLGTTIFIGTVLTSFNPTVRTLLQGGSQKKDLEEPKVRSKSQRPIQPGKVTDPIEAKLRAEYHLRLETELAKELVKARALDRVQKEQSAPKVILEMPQGVVTDITNLSNGIPLRTEILYGSGETAMEEIQLHDSYTAQYQLKMRVPRPAIRISEIEIGTPDLSKILPGFRAMFPTGFVSPWHETLYRNKVSEIRANSKQLNLMMSKPDAYDCNTILHLKSEKGRKVFFMQADMDAILKGSDGDRLPEMTASHVQSIQYDPFTAYHWRKTGNKPNPMIAEWERRIAIGRTELKEPALTPARKAWVEERIAMLNSGIEAMKKRGYLISAHDPYIVLPIGLIIDKEDPFAPKIGDYAVVIHGRTIYPCIVGDRGADSTVGEASALLAAQLNPEWKPGSKAVAYPRVSYVVFPGTAETNPEPPEYDKWMKKCYTLLGEIGGFGNGFQYHKWTDTLSESIDNSSPKTKIK